MPQFYNSKILTYHFHIDNAQIDYGIGYDMIIGRALMVQLGQKANFGCQILKWGKTVITMKQPVTFLAQSDITKLYMTEVVIQA